DNIAYRLAFNSLRETYEPLRSSLQNVLADELQDVTTHVQLARAVDSADEEKAARVASRLLAKGTAAITEVLSALNE
ncbi:MAG: hypothetical protein QOH90_2408, partial [Actinomycetota bacterium]|nr:hypothetical protein [Actinomycetota bacterium]